ncbi:uncharacterized protein LOC135098157 isoform X3 [Scylla paramamosain]|uniref:uncharacterized protein LOC135098157 isoform X3 n=1 Tax=Scylla paramamosain TaxID=85552 RepID=UPI00308399AE
MFIVKYWIKIKPIRDLDTCFTIYVRKKTPLKKQNQLDFRGKLQQSSSVHCYFLRVKAMQDVLPRFGGVFRTQGRKMKPDYLAPQRMDSLGYHTEGGEGALGMPEGGAVKEGGLEVKEMQKIPLILSASLVRPSFTEYLDRGFKIRVSQATLQNSAILPTCGVAALIVPLPPSSSSSSSSSSSIEETFDQLVDRVRAFSRVHAGGVVILVGAVFGMEEVNGVLGKLSRRLLPRPPLLLPAHGEAQAAAHIQLLAKK